MVASKLLIAALAAACTFHAATAAAGIDSEVAAHLERTLSNSKIAYPLVKRLLQDNSSISPQQLKLSLEGDDGGTAMHVAFVTWALCNGSITVWPTASGEGSAQTVPTALTTYTAGLGGWSGWVHDVSLTGLTPGTSYTYFATCTEAGNPPNSGPKSLPRSFSTAPVPGPNVVTTVAVLADWGTIQGLGYLVADALLEQSQYGLFNPNYTLVAGDLSYATVDPGTPNSEVEWSWDSYGIMCEPFSSVAPFQTVVGNHESPSGSVWNATGKFDVSFASFSARYFMPSNGYLNFWWAYTYGSVRYVSISSEHDYTPGSAQYTWLAKQLAAVDRSVTPWVMVMLHRPILCTDASEWSSHCPGGQLSAALEPLLNQYHVDLVIHGHMHMYERMHATYNGTVVTLPVNGTYTNPGAPLYLVQATAGAVQDESFISPQPAWSAYREAGSYGFGRMTVNGATELSYDFVDVYGQVHDSWRIVKTAGAV